MFSKNYHLKFASADAAQIAAPFVVETMGNAIPECNLVGMKILISTEGDISINLFFKCREDLKMFDKKHGGFLRAMKETFTFKSSGFEGVCVFTYDSAEDSSLST